MKSTLSLAKMWSARSLLTVAAALILSPTVNAQTVLLDPAGPGGFENGADFTSNGWVVVNSTTATPNRNAWFVGPIGLSAGANGAYISNSTTGTHNNYFKTTAQVSHFYRDVVIPAGATNIQVSFKWRANGEGSSIFYDYIRAFHIPGTSTPTAGTQLANGTGGAVQLGGTFNLQTGFQTFNGTIDNSFAGSTRRLVFSWRNDASGGSDPAGSIDEVSITYTPPCSAVAAGAAATTTPNINCNGTPSLSLTSGTTGGGITYQWQSRLVGTTTWGNVGALQTSTTFIAPSISASTEYHVISTCPTSSATATSAPVTVTVTSISVSPVTSSICEGSSQALAVSVPTIAPGPLLNATFNTGTDGFTFTNTTTGTAPGVAAFTLRPNNFSLTATGGPYVFTPGSQFLLSDADNVGSGASVNVTMTSPVINTAGATSLSLSFKHHLKYLNASTIVKAEVFNGTSWVQVTPAYTSTQGTVSAFSTVTLDIVAHANANMQVRFTYIDAWGYYWAVDDVIVTGVIPTTLAWVPLAGGGLPAGAETPNVANNNISVTPTATGSLVYTVNSNNCGTATTTVNVTPAAAITAQPAVTSIVCEGGDINLDVTADNAVSYEWHGPSGIVGTSSTLNIPNATTTMSGNYYVIVTGANPCSSVQSNFAAVTVNPAMSITTQPAAQNLCEGANIDLIIDAANVVSYQWYTSNGIINDGGSTSGATTMNVVISPSVLADAGSYYVALTGLPGCGTLNSNSVPVLITPAVNITTNIPAALNICDGADLNLSVVADNATGYLWYKDGAALSDINNISGSGTASLTITGTTAADAGDYYVVISGDGPCASVNSNTTTVINDQPASVVTDPADMTACYGRDASTTVVATGANLTYQWYEGSTLLSDNAIYGGTSTATLTINDVSGLDGRKYSAVITGSCGSPVASDSAVLNEDFNNIWDGSTDNNWSDVTNWSCGILPTAVTNAIIPDVANDPIVDFAGAICKDLLVAADASVTFTGTGNQLEVRGNIDVDPMGTLDGTDGTVLLSGIATQQVNGATIFEDLEIDGGTTKTIGGNATVTGELILTDGFISIGNNDLTITDMSLQTTGSATSYVVTDGTGEVVGQNMGADSTVFHVGLTTSYNPVGIKNTGDADTFSVRVMANVFVDGDGTNPALVTNPVVDRTWMISEQTPGGSFASVTPQWNAAEEINGFNPLHVYVAHYMGGVWTSELDSALYAGPRLGTDPYTTMEDSITSFSPFAVASSGQFPLAIRMATISATNVGTRNKVEWKSATEATGDVYEVESSVDAKSFRKIATVAANGKPSSYLQWDENPAQGVNYYRVKLIDAAGKFSYSKVVTATVNGTNNFTIEAYPNPVHNTVSVKVSGVVTGKGSVVVTDVTGKVVTKATVVENNTAELNVNHLANGMYLLNYTDDVRNESIKINKQ